MKQSNKIVVVDFPEGGKVYYSYSENRIIFSVNENGKKCSFDITDGEIDCPESQKHLFVIR